jgi:hypothetical protein
MGSRTAQLAQGPAGDRSEAKGTAWLCGPAVALDRRAHLAWLGRWRRLKSEYECLPETTEALIHIHSHCDDSAHAAKTGVSVTLFKRALRRDNVENGGSQLTHPAQQNRERADIDGSTTRRAAQATPV